MPSQLLPPEQWTIEPVLIDGAPSGDVIVGAWQRDGTREFVKVTNPSGSYERPPGVLTFAKVHGPPEDWFGLRIVDLDTGVEVPEVSEVDTVAGYVVTFSGGHKVRRYGRFKIRRPEAA